LKGLSKQAKKMLQDKHNAEKEKSKNSIRKIRENSTDKSPGLKLITIDSEEIKKKLMKRSLKSKGRAHKK
jgi:hypothetical protein